MDKWSSAYEEAHAALKHARSALEHLVEVTESPDGLGDRVRSACDALHGVRALLDEAGQEQKIAKPRIALDVDRILRTARLRRGKKRRQLWDSGTDVCRQLENMYNVSPAETRRLIAALEAGLTQAKTKKGLHLDPFGS